MPIRVNLPDECGLGQALSVIGGRWKSAILWELHERALRFGELRRRLPGISEKVLYEQLREMERDGLVVRTVHPVIPPHVDYTLTELGRELSAAFCGVWTWAETYYAEVSAARRAFREREEG